MSLTIVEVIDRSAQGFTKPYVCRGDDGEVKVASGDLELITNQNKVEAHEGLAARAARGDTTRRYGDGFDEWISLTTELHVGSLS